MTARGAKCVSGLFAWPSLVRLLDERSGAARVARRRVGDSTKQISDFRLARRMLALRWAALHWIVSTAHATSIPTTRLDAGRLAKLEAASANLEEAVELERTRRLQKELLGMGPTPGKQPPFYRQTPVLTKDILEVRCIVLGTYF